MCLEMPRIAEVLYLFLKKLFGEDPRLPSNAILLQFEYNKVVLKSELYYNTIMSPSTMLFRCCDFFHFSLLLKKILGPLLFGAELLRH